MKNYHNTHIGAHNNTKWHSTMQVSAPITGLCTYGIIYDNLICPYALLEQLNGHFYLRFSWDQLPALLRSFLLAVLADMHDGAAAHFSRPVRKYLEDTLGCWRQGSRSMAAMFSPPQPFGLLFVGHLKYLSYRHPAPDVNPLQQRIFNKCADIRIYDDVFR